MSLIQDDFGVDAANPWNKLDLYEPISDWTDGRAYPALVPDSFLKQSDYLRMAWEVLRRAPRYRMHFKRLTLSNLTSEDAFFHRTSHLSKRDDKFRLFPRWESVEVQHHYCSPAAKEGQLLGDYAEEHKSLDWMVMHGHRWAMNFWGTTRLIDPKIQAADIDLAQFFSPSKPSIVNPWAKPSSDGAFPKSEILGNEIPFHYSTVLTPREIILRLRADLPAAQQIEAATALLTGIQLKRGMKGAGSRARFTELGVASFWLRTWDFESANKATPRIPRSELIRHLDGTISSLDPELKKFVETGQRETFLDRLHDGLNSRKIDNWRNRTKSYIVKDQDFYRNLLAKAFS